MKISRLWLLTLLSPLLWSCDSSDSPQPQTRDQAGFLDSLYGPASPSEVQLARTSLSTLPLSGPANPTTLLDTTLPAAVFEGVSVKWTVDTGRVQVFTHNTHAGAHAITVWRPKARIGQKLPILIYAHGGAAGLSLLELQLFVGGMGTLSDSFAIVAPVYRGEALTFGARLLLLAAGARSPWDRDVDDILSGLRAAAKVLPDLDTTRVSILGLSRGGASALLATARDRIIDRSVIYFAPTDFLSPWSRLESSRILSGNGRNLPGMDVFDSTILQPTWKDNMSISHARIELLRRSPLYMAPFMDRPILVLHGTADSTVPVTESRRLDSAYRASNVDITYREVPGEGHATPSLFLTVSPNVQAFLLAGLRN